MIRVMSGFILLVYCYDGASYGSGRTIFFCQYQSPGPYPGPDTNWRDTGIELTCGSIAIGLAACMCSSPSVYFQSACTWLSRCLYL